MRITLSVILAALLIASGAAAQSNSLAKIQPHLVPAGGPNPCSPSNSLVPCASIATAGRLEPTYYYAYVLVTDGNSTKGVAGLQFGLDYEAAAGSGVDIFGWTRCADLEFSGSGWPAAGTGTTITWVPESNCQSSLPGGPGSGVVAAAGYFYLGAYSADVFRITAHPAVGSAKVADCMGAESVLPGASLGTARFSTGGNEPGISPCVGEGLSDPSCSISGPGTVVEGTSSPFQVTASGTPTSYSWSITGNGTLQGPTNGTSITVIAGSPGSYTLQMTFTTATGTWSCSRTVTVEAITCAVSGPSIVPGNSTRTFSLVTNAVNPQPQWSISGAGTISGSSSGTQVQVLSGANGQFTLTCAFTSATGSRQCAITVDINNLVFTCLISGPSTVIVNSTGNVYTATTEIPATAWFWSISGSGTIAGSTSGSQVSVTAGAAGSFTLGLSYSGPSGTGNCAKQVGVQVPNQMSCSISGPTGLPEGAIGQYSVTTVPAATGWSWSVTGNGTINGSATGPTVAVVAGSPGSFTVSVSVTDGSIGAQCSRSVNVIASQPEGPNQGNAKIFLHVTAPTAKNACATQPVCSGAAAQVPGLVPTAYFAYVMVGDGYTNGASRSGIGGIQFGIRYNNTPNAGVDIYSWAHCATLEFPSTGWPAPEGGNLITWDGTNNCQRTLVDFGAAAVAGYFYLGAYSTDQLQIIPRPVDNAAKVANCYGAESLIAGSGANVFPSPLGVAGFGGVGGYNPCGLVVPVENTTWSRIKAMGGRSR